MNVKTYSMKNDIYPYPVETLKHWYRGLTRRFI